MIPQLLNQLSNGISETSYHLMVETGKILHKISFATVQKIYQERDFITGYQLTKMVGKSCISASIGALVVKKQPFSAKASEYSRLAFLFGGLAVFSHLVNDYCKDELNFTKARNEQNDLLDKYPLLGKIFSRVNDF